MRTDQEIIDRIRDVQGGDPFGFETGDLITRLEFKDAKEWLKPDAKPGKWDAEFKDAKSVKHELVDYLPFAWEKANDCRGISAYRSLCHMRAWLWLLQEDEFLREHDLMEYEFYGKEHLVPISEKFGFDWREHDSGCWQREECDDGITAEQALA